jgi:hypothetical protein
VPPETRQGIRCTTEARQREQLYSSTDSKPDTTNKRHFRFLSIVAANLRGMWLTSLRSSSNGRALMLGACRLGLLSKVVSQHTKVGSCFGVFLNNVT